MLVIIRIIENIICLGKKTQNIFITGATGCVYIGEDINCVGETLFRGSLCEHYSMKMYVD